MDYEQVFDELEERLSSIDYEPTDRDTLEIEHEERTSTHHLLFVEVDPGPSFVISAKEGDSFCRVQAQYDLWRQIADQISEEQIEKLVEEDIAEIADDHAARELPVDVDELDDQQQRELLATVGMLTGVGQDAREETIYQLTDIFTAAEVKHSIDSLGGNEGLSGFSVKHKIFPQEDEFTRSQLNNAVERVRMAAHRGEIFLRYAFGLGVDRDFSSDGDVTSDLESPPSR